MSQAVNVDRNEELSLLSAVLAGDRRAGRHFFQRYNYTIESCVRSVLGRRRPSVTEDEVRDMVSDIWVCLLEDDKKSLRRFDPGRDIRVATWISLLARNKTIDHLRTSHEVSISMGHALDAIETPAQRPLPAEELEERECWALANRALQQLRPRERQFLAAWYVEHLTPEEIAQQLGISVATVYSRRTKIQEKLGRAIRRLNRPRRAARPTLH